MTRRWRQRLVEGYFLASPVFALIDVVYDAPVRAAAIPDRHLRYVYYAATLACGILCHLRPRLTPFIGVGESAVNLLLLLLGVIVPILDAPIALWEGRSIDAGLDVAGLVNFLLSGTVLIACFHWSQRALRG